MRSVPPVPLAAPVAGVVLVAGAVAGVRATARGPAATGVRPMAMALARRGGAALVVVPAAAALPTSVLG